MRKLRLALWAGVLSLLPMLSGCRPAAVESTRPPVVARQHTFKRPTEDEYWRTALMEVYKTSAEIQAQQQADLAHGLRYAMLARGDTRRKEIALTFDDGPHPEYTPKLLAVLEKYKVKATFLVVGMMAERAPNLLKDELAAGHNVGNHTYHHVDLLKVSPQTAEAEIKACGEVIQSVSGQPPHLFRPPGGDYNRPVAAIAEALGYLTVLWTDDPGDYASPGQRVIETKTLDRVSNGGIILLHDGIQQTIDVLPQIIEYLQHRGYTFVTIDEMRRESGDLPPVRHRARPDEDANPA
jgi:peptidoglycan-N-acetylglucosamine deacetylase